MLAAARISVFVLALAGLISGCGGGALPGAKTAGTASDPTSARGTSASSASATSVSLHLAGTVALPEAVQLPATTTGAGGVLALGGLDSADSSLASVTLITGSDAHALSALPSAEHDAAAASIGGQAYLFGGGDAGSTSSAILRVDGTGAQLAGRLPMGTSDVAAATVAGTAYVVGGYTATGPLRTIVAFTPGRGAHVVARMPWPLRYAAVAAVGGRVLIAGGTSGTSAERAILTFDPADDRVTQIGELPHALTHAAGAALNGVFYVIGGRGEGLFSQRRSILAIDPRTGAVHAAGRLPAPLSDLGATALGGAIVAVGGRDRAGHAHDLALTLRPTMATTGARAASAHRDGARGVEVPHPGLVPPALDLRNVYAADRPGLLSPVVRGDPALVYVPNSRSNTVDVISQRTFKIVEHFAVGALPQHVTPAWNLRTLYVTNDEGNSLTPIDPRTGRPGDPIPVTDPYNLYFTPDGRWAIVVAEAHRELDFRDPRTMALHHALQTPECLGVDHMDFTAGGRYALASCEFAGRVIVVDLRTERVIKTIALARGAMPQDVKLSPDGRTFYVADMALGGVWLIDARTMRVLGFVLTGAGAHGLYPSRDGRVLYVSNRMEGSISVLSFATRRPIAKWRLPGGGSPDMGGLSADGRVLWLSGRDDGVVYAISTSSGRLLHEIKVGEGPHGLCVWPQPGRYSIGHTGILR